jgi:multidrug efflux pump subunit AcrB
MSLTRYSLKHQVVVIALVLVAFIGGLAEFLTMPRRADPSFTLRLAQVVTPWPGAKAESIEQYVTAPLEEEFKRLAEVSFVRSTTANGLSVIFVELDKTLPTKSIPQVWDRVRDRIGRVRGSFPAGVRDPIVNDEFADTAVMLVALYEKGVLGQAEAGEGIGKVPEAERDGGRYSPRELEVIAERVREKIAALAGVARAELHGVRKEAIYLETTHGNWSHLDLTLSDLEKLLQARNIYAPGGSIEAERSRIGVYPSGAFDAVEQIESVVVRRDPSGSPVHLRDLGIEVRRGYEEPPGILAHYGNLDGSAPAIIISFTMKDGFKVTDLGREVRQLLGDLQRSDKVVPPDIGLDVVFDESVFVEQKIGDFVENLIQAILIVMFVALLLAGLRSAMVMAAAIPFVMVISIGIAATIGVELEQMAIASLIIALGLLVDNAVVVTDNVRRFQRAGYGRLESVAQGVEQIQKPILMGTLTTVFAFLPLLFFVTGEKQEYIFSLPTVVSITLLTSWVLALTITALMVYWFVPPKAAGQGEDKTFLTWLAAKRGGRSGRERGASDGSPGAYESLVRGALKAKPLVLGAVVALLVGVAYLPIGTQFFPSDKRDVFYVDVWLPEGSSLAATESVARQVETILRDTSKVETEDFTGERLSGFYTSIGGSGPRFALGVNPQPRYANFAQIIGKTTDPQVTEDYIADIRTAAMRQVAGARVVPKKLSLGPPIDSPLAVRLYGTGFLDPGFAVEDTLRAQADRVKNLFGSMNGVWDVHDTWGNLGFDLDVNIDEDRANLAGITNASVAKSLNAYFSGDFLTMFREGDRQVPIYFRLPRYEREMVKDPKNIFVEGQSGKVPLDSVADVHLTRQTTKIERRHNNRMIEVRAQVEAGVLANSKLAEALPGIRDIEATLPPGMSLEIAGEHEKTVESVGQMSIALAVAVMLIVLVLVVQYNSFVKPLVILMTVPMGAIGGLFGLWVTGNSLGFMPMLGLVSLAGIVVNSGILYIEFADQLIREKLEKGQDLANPGEKSYNGLTRQGFHACLAQAGKERMLPIFLTVSTTVGGLLPLAFFGGPMWEGMAFLMIFGLIVATGLTLLVLPTIYAAFVEYFGVKLVVVESAPDASHAA